MQISCDPSLTSLKPALIKVVGADSSAAFLSIARDHADAAGLGHAIEWRVADAADVEAAAAAFPGWAATSGTKVSARAARQPQADHQQQRQQQPGRRTHQAQQQVRDPGADAPHPVADRTAGGGVERRVARPIADQRDEGEQRREAERDAAEQARRAPRRLAGGLPPPFEPAAASLSRGRRRHAFVPQMFPHPFMRPGGLPGQALGVAPGQR